MKILIGISCIGCGACIGECPMGALSINEDGIVECNSEQCILCGSCINTCPIGNISIVNVDDFEEE